MADELKESLMAGLTSSPKYLPTWFNYDNIGSKLQHKSVVENPDYYLTRCQISILNESVQDIIQKTSYDLALVDLGSGNCSTTRKFIDELLKRQKSVSFYPVDISGEFLMNAADALSEEYNDSIIVKPIAADYVRGIEKLKKVQGPKLILWIGSMINLPYETQVNTLRMISTIMTDKCRLVFSADITQNKDSIMKAYNDKAGLKRAFIQHAIARLNRESGSQIDLGKFSYELNFMSNSDPKYMSYVIAYIEAKEDIRYQLPRFGIDLVMEKGEQLYFHEGDGYSCKYTLEQLQNIVGKAGLQLTKTWMDENGHAVFCRCKT